MQSARHAQKHFVYSAIIMEAMREAWTDERMDDLVARVDRGFAQTDAWMDRFNAQMDKFERLLLATFLTTLASVLTAHF